MVPIEKMKNLGPKTASELNQLGISSREEFLEIGYRNVFLKWISIFPERIHLMAWYALVGAELDIHYSKVPERQREEGRVLIESIRKRRKLPLRARK